MNTQKHNQTPAENPSSPLARTILARIEQDALTPSPKWHFRIFEYGVWVLWVVSIFIGSLSVAVIYFSAEHARFALFEVTHRSALAFYITVLPYIWIILFMVMAVWAYYNLRRTRHGYRYPFWQILVSSLIFSFVGGLILHWFNLGMAVDHTLGQNFAAYPSVARLEAQMWEHPAQGLLVGELMIPTQPTTTAHFIDDQGMQWVLNTSELQRADRLLLLSGLQVRLLGTTTSAADHTFYVCGVFPWEFDRANFSISDLQHDRQTFVSRVHNYLNTRNQDSGPIGSEFGMQTATDSPSVCSQIWGAKNVSQ